jgi:hypothetical protein
MFLALILISSMLWSILYATIANLLFSFAKSQIFACGSRSNRLKRSPRRNQIVSAMKQWALLGGLRRLHDPAQYQAIRWILAAAG